MQRAGQRTVKVLEVSYTDDASRGPGGDGHTTKRFASSERAEAERFAATRRCYREPATVREYEASRATARRWGLA
jgi:hypothetical protein